MANAAPMPINIRLWKAAIGMENAIESIVILDEFLSH
jgi:hypothetical protein